MIPWPAAALAVEIDVDQVAGIELRLDPRAMVRNNAERVQDGSIGMLRFFKADARRTVQLASCSQNTDKKLEKTLAALCPVQCICRADLWMLSCDLPRWHKAFSEFFGPTDTDKVCFDTKRNVHDSFLCVSAPLRENNSCIFEPTRSLVSEKSGIYEFDYPGAAAWH